jgi:malonyl-CoA O-methyltransferase
VTDAPAAPLPARDAYRLWAPTYGAENPTTALDQTAVEQLTPPLVGKGLLDAGCGTGRRLPGAGPKGPRWTVGIDLVPEMLRRGKHRTPELRLAAADLRALPFDDRRFDAVWCRLAIGHVVELDRAYSELARVTRRGGCLIVTDFHPEATRAGHVRSFRDAEGTLHVIAHHLHEPLDHQHAAARAGLSFDTRLDLVVGPPVRAFYETAGLLDRYVQQRGLPLVLALRFAG